MGSQKSGIFIRIAPDRSRCTQKAFLGGPDSLFRGCLYKINFPLYKIFGHPRPLKILPPPYNSKEPCPRR